MIEIDLPWVALFGTVACLVLALDANDLRLATASPYLARNRGRPGDQVPPPIPNRWRNHEPPPSTPSGQSNRPHTSDTPPSPIEPSKEKEGAEARSASSERRDPERLEQTQTYDVRNPVKRRAVLERLALCKKQGRSVILLAGPTNSGKTILRFRLGARATDESLAVADRSSDRTPALRVGVLDLPRRPVIVDIAGEDFSALGDPRAYDVKEGRSDNANAPRYFSQFLAPVLKSAAGLIVLLDFPSIWDKANQPAGAKAADLGAVLSEVQKQEEALARSVTNLLRLMALAQGWDRVRRYKGRSVHAWDGNYNDLSELTAGTAPIRPPVAFILSKADVFLGEDYSGGFFAPEIRADREFVGLHRARIDPTRHHPAFVVKRRLPELWAYIMKRVDHPVFGFVQSMDYGRPEAEDAAEIKMRTLNTMAGDSLIAEVFGLHPWVWPPSRLILPLILRTMPQADPWQGSF